MYTLETIALQTELETQQTAAVRALTEELGRPPHLEIYLGIGPQGADGASANYVRMKTNYGKRIGMTVVPHELEATDIEELILVNNERSEVDGQMVQLPVPGVSRGGGAQICELINMTQDVDGMRKRSPFVAATSLGIVRYLDHLGLDLAGSTVVLNGSESQAVGKPLQGLLQKARATVIPIDLDLHNTCQLRTAISISDILITCTGVPGLIKDDLLRDDLYVIDAGVRIQNEVQVGDLHPSVFESAKKFHANPPKGTIGPLTIRMLAGNTITATAQKRDALVIA